MSRRVPPAAGFAIVALIPAVLLIWGAGTGGWPVWAGFLWMAAASPAADTIIARGFGDAGEGTAFPAADMVSVLLALAHFILMGVMLWGLAGDWLGTGERIALFIGVGMFFGQVSNSNAHELIHRSGRGLFRLGSAVYVSMLFGHHVSAHRLIHHVYVATDSDPNSARFGESFWHFFPRAWFGSFNAGLVAERQRAERSGRQNPYMIWVGGAVVCICAVGLAFGIRVMVDYVAICLYAQMQLMLSDYVQHYGLRRKMQNGRPEPVGLRHSWDAPHPLSSLAMVNAPRHSDHHAHPARIYPALRLNPENPRPMLPYSLPVMGAIAMMPPLWRRVMDRRVKRMEGEG
ncbi:MAG: alkane 1-monooxygenase [Paracoccus sp. (in: a-proteobacteria)]